jgi:hypothetical protein
MGLPGMKKKKLTATCFDKVQIKMSYSIPFAHIGHQEECMSEGAELIL